MKKRRKSIKKNTSKVRHKFKSDRPFDHRDRKNRSRISEPPRDFSHPRKSSSTVLGWIDRTDSRHYFQLRPFIKDLNIPIFIHRQDLAKHDVKMHGIVRANLIKPKARGHDFTAEIIQAYVSLDDQKLELEICAERHAFPQKFSDEALRDVERSKDLKPGHRQDLTRSCSVTIDGETAKDFDDAICVERKSDGSFQLKVSIADVTHFVRPGTKLDQEAFERATSIYFPGFVVPMLPHELSDNLCSLVPHEERYTLTCEMVYSPQGKRKATRIYPSVIRSRARLTYTNVARVFKGEQVGLDPDVHEMLHHALELSRLIRKDREDRGAMDLDLPELEVDCDEFGNVRGVELRERNEAHRLIEDFMIAANEAVSESLEEKNIPLIFRVHEDPDPEKIERLQSIIKHWGFQLSEKLDVSEALQQLLYQVRGHEAEKTLVISTLRSLKQARYAAENLGHFGLGSKSYCHFTSPIRRYPDLIVHRILRQTDFLKNPSAALPVEQLQQMADHCSFAERRAFLAERDMEDLKKCRFMEPLVGREFEGVITSIKSFGIFVELFPHHIEGLIPFRLLPSDYWAVDELETHVKGQRNRVEFWLGEKIRVRLVEVNRLLQQITLQAVLHSKRESSERSDKRDRSRHRGRKWR